MKDERRRTEDGSRWQGARAIANLWNLAVLSLLALAFVSCAPAPVTGPQRFTGFLESEEVAVAPELGGRIQELLVEEGDVVRAGQLVARLDDSLVRLQLAQAEANVAQAKARLAQLKAGARPEEVALAQARLAQAQAALEVAELALEDAIRLRDNPQELDVQITQAQAALAEARARARAARFQAQAADLEAQMWGEIAQDLARGQTVTLPNGVVITVQAPPDKKHQANVQWNLASQKAWQAWQQAAQADAAVGQAQATLADRRRQREENQEAEARVVASTNARDKAQVELQRAQAALDAVTAGAPEAQIQAAEAALAQAQAARDAQALALEKVQVTAPAAGVVAARAFAPGEVIAPGQRLLTIQQPERLTIIIYVPAGMVDALQVGDVYPLVADTAPGRRYQARVQAIADEPEFSLRQSQNVAERAAVVYAVTLEVEEPDELLRPGTPADVLVAP